MTATLTDPWAVAADEVLPADAPRDVWLAERRNGLGGSDSSVVFGLNRYASPIGLWMDKTGRADDLPDNDYMEWGRRLEPVVRGWFSDHYGMEVRQRGLLRHRDLPVLQYTTDGLTEDGGLIEIKTLEWHTEYEWADGQTPDHAEMQLQKGLLVTGRSHGYAIGLVNGRRPHVRRIERDDELIAEIARYETWWWNTYVLADEMPPLDNTQATNAAIQSMFPTADPGRILTMTPELLALYRELDAAKRVADEAAAAVVGVESKIRLALKDAAMVVIDPDEPCDDTAAGKRNVLATAANNGTFAGKRFTADHPDIAAACMAPKPTLDVERLKKEHAELYNAYRARVVRTRKALTDLLAAPAPGTKPGGN